MKSPRRFGERRTAVTGKGTLNKSFFTGAFFVIELAATLWIGALSRSIESDPVLIGFFDFCFPIIDLSSCSFMFAQF
jgi:hypothetical protein